MSPRRWKSLRVVGIAGVVLFVLNFVVGIAIGNGKTLEIRCFGGGVFIAWGADNVDRVSLHGVHYIEYTRGFRTVTTSEGLPLCSLGYRWIDTPMTRVAFFSWSPLPAAFLIWFSPAIFRWFRGRKLLPGHCRTCGYNLTGNVSGVCPECGMKVDLGDTGSSLGKTNQRPPTQFDPTYTATLLRLFPDLGLITDEQERDRIYGAALLEARMWRIALPVYGILITVLLGVFLIAGWYPPSRDKFALGLGITLGHCALASLLVWRGHRRRMNRTVWRELAALGIRICGSCGYNLAGNTSGVCPECGSTVPNSRLQP